MSKVSRKRAKSQRLRRAKAPRLKSKPKSKTKVSTSTKRKTKAQKAAEFTRRSEAAKRGWAKRKEWAHRKEAAIERWRKTNPNLASNTKELGKFIDAQIKAGVRIEVKRIEAEVMSAAIDRQIESLIKEEKWTDSDESRILGRLFLMNKLDPADFDQEVQDIADEYDDWSAHDIYDLWFYGEVA